MKRKNLLTNILNILGQIGFIIWLFMYQEGYELIVVANTSILGIIIALLVIITSITIATINLVVGIKNRKNSKAILVLYIINFVLFLFQPVWYILVESTYEDFFGVLTIINYITIYILTIVLFILNRKTPKNEKKIKYDVIIFVIAVILVVFTIIAPKLYLIPIKSKFEKAAVNENEVNSQEYVLVHADEQYDFISAEGKVELSIKADEVSRPYFAFTSSGVVKYVIAEEGDRVQVIDINDVKNIKPILEYEKITSIDNEFSYIFNQNKRINSMLLTNEEEQDNLEENNKLFLKEETSKYLKYEDNENYKYTYYGNNEITIQVAEVQRSDLSQSNMMDENQVQYYLIKNDERIQLDCDKLVFGYDENIQQDYIYFFDNKYVPFIGENTNGYIDANGQKTEIANSYVFLDKSDNIGIVARINEKDKGRDSEIEQPIDVIVVDNDQRKISDIYDGAIVCDTLYVLYHYENYSYVNCSIWSKEGKEIAKNLILEGTTKNGLIATISPDNSYIDFYNEKGKLNDKQYKPAGNIQVQLSKLGYEEGENAYWIYKDIVSKIK